MARKQAQNLIYRNIHTKKQINNGFPEHEESHFASPGRFCPPCINETQAVSPSRRLLDTCRNIQAQLQYEFVLHFLPNIFSNFDSFFESTASLESGLANTQNEPSLQITWPLK